MPIDSQCGFFPARGGADIDGSSIGRLCREGVEVNRQYAGASPSGGDKKVDIYGNLENLERGKG